MLTTGSNGYTATSLSAALDLRRGFGLSRETVGKMCRFSLPPGYTRTTPVAKPKLGALLLVIDAILEGERTAPVKQRHTGKRIFERLRDEHGFADGYNHGEGLHPHLPGAWA